MALLKRSVILMGILLLINASFAQADVKQAKIYKEAFPDAKPKCTDCHIGTQKELNEYGKKVVAIANPPTAETYKAAGKAS